MSHPTSNRSHLPSSPSSEGECSATEPAAFCSWHRLPRARIDPITTAPDALRVISLAVRRPLVAETIVLILDDARRGLSLISVDGTTDDDAIVNVVECFAATAGELETADSLIVASVRPEQPVTGSDVDRWLEASELSDRFGVELVEWFVISGSAAPNVIACPRDLLGERPRW